MDWEGTPRPVPLAAPDREEVVMLWMVMVVGVVLKVSPHPVDHFASCSSAIWRGFKYAAHFFYVYSAVGLLYHSGLSLGEELVAMI